MTHLKVGELAPLFSTVDQAGLSQNLADYFGKKVVLFCYPKDDTPGCTAEACSLRDGYAELLGLGLVLLGLSPDDAKKHKKFIEKHELPFPLLLDTEKVILNAYGIWSLKKFMGKEYMGVERTTFIIDETGKLEQVITKVDTANHSKQILDLLTGNQ